MLGHEIAFICTDRRKQKLFTTELPRPILISVVDGGQLGCAGWGNGLLAIVIDSSSASPAVERSLAVRREHSAGAPVILLTPDWDRGSEAPPWADGVVSWNRVGGRMWPAVRRVIIEWVLAASVQRICAGLKPDGGLAAALPIVFSATPPFPSVEALADRHEVCARGYFVEWKETFGVGTTLADLMDWYLLMRTLAAKVPHQGWTEACRVTETTQPRIKRIAERLIGEIDLEALEHDESLRAIHGFWTVCTVLTKGYSVTQGISRID